MRNSAKRSPKGFTVLSLLLVVLVMGVLFYGLIYSIVLAGNMYVTQESSLACIQFEDPTVSKIVKVERNVFAKTKVTAENEKGDRSSWLIDSNILFNLDCERAEK